MTSLGILSLGGGCYNINKQQLIKEIEKFHEIDNSLSIEELCQKLILFSKENFGVEFSIEERVDITPKNKESQKSPVKKLGSKPSSNK